MFALLMSQFCYTTYLKHQTSMTTSTSQPLNAQVPTLPSTSSPSGYLTTLPGVALPLQASSAPPPAPIGAGTQTGLIWHNRVTGENSLWQLQGTSFSQTVDLPTITDTRWQLAGSYDFNFDGRFDLLWRNSITGENSVWLMNGTTIAQIATLPSVTDSQWHLEGVSNLHSTFNSPTGDLVWRNTATGEVSVWFMGGAEGTSLLKVVSAGAVTDTSWQIEAVGHVNGYFNSDMNSDLVWRNRVTGDVSVWLMDQSLLDFSISVEIRKTVSFGSVTDTHWQIQGIRDFNYDGQADFFWHNNATGENSVWLMNNYQPTSVVSLGIEADPNWTPIVAELHNFTSPNFQPITQNQPYYEFPSASGTTVVWSGWDGQDSEIYLYDGTTTRTLTNNSVMDLYPQVSGQSVVWQQIPGNGDNGDIYLYDGTRTIALANSANSEVHPQISGQNVVWEGWDGEDWEIYLYDGTSTRALTNNQANDTDVQIAGNRVVWRSQTSRSDGSIDSQIFLYDGTQVRQLTNTTQPNYNPVVSNTLVAWSQQTGVGTSDIYLYDGQTTRQVGSTNLPWNMNTVLVTVSDTRVLWSNMEVVSTDPLTGTQYSQFVYSLSDGQTTQRVNSQGEEIGSLTARAAVLVGSDVYWVGHDHKTPEEGLFRFSNGQTTRLGTTQVAGYSGKLTVSGSRATWESYTAEGFNLYTATV